jgi:hypothetical protein
MEFRYGPVALLEEVARYLADPAVVVMVVAPRCLTAEAARLCQVEAEAARRYRWAAPGSRPEEAGLPKKAVLTRHHTRRGQAPTPSTPDD